MLIILNPFISSCEFSKNKNKNSVKLSSQILKNDIVILATDHDKFNYNFIKKYSRFIIDCRGKYNLDKKIVRGYVNYNPSANKLSKIFESFI